MVRIPLFTQEKESSYKYISTRDFEFLKDYKKLLCIIFVMKDSNWFLSHWMYEVRGHIARSRTTNYAEMPSTFCDLNLLTISKSK